MIWKRLMKFLCWIGNRCLSVVLWLLFLFVKIILCMVVKWFFLKNICLVWYSLMFCVWKLCVVSVFVGVFVLVCMLMLWFLFVQDMSFWKFLFNVVLSIGGCFVKIWLLDLLIVRILFLLKVCLFGVINCLWCVWKWILFVFMM